MMKSKEPQINYEYLIEADWIHQDDQAGHARKAREIKYEIRV